MVTGDVLPASYPIYRELRDKNDVMQALAADCPINFAVKIGSETKTDAGRDRNRKLFRRAGRARGARADAYS